MVITGFPRGLCVFAKTAKFKFGFLEKKEDLKIRLCVNSKSQRLFTRYVSYTNISATQKTFQPSPLSCNYPLRVIVDTFKLFLQSHIAVIKLNGIFGPS